MQERSQAQPTDLLFPIDHKRQFNRILEDLDLRFDREGNLNEEGLRAPIILKLDL